MIGLLAKASSGPRSKWVVIAVWIVLLVVSLPGSMTIDEVTSDQTATAESLPSDSDAARVAEELAGQVRRRRGVLALSVYQRAGGLTDADRAKIAADAKAVQGVAGVRQVLAPSPLTPDLNSKDGTTAFIAIPINEPNSDKRTESIEDDPRAHRHRRATGCRSG